MAIHIAANIAQKAGRDDTDGAEGEADQIDVLVGFGEGDLAGLDDDGVGGFVGGADAGDGPEGLEQRGRRVGYRCFDAVVGGLEVV